MTVGLTPPKASEHCHEQIGLKERQWSRSGGWIASRDVEYTALRVGSRRVGYRTGVVVGFKVFWVRAFF